MFELQSNKQHSKESRIWVKRSSHNLFLWNVLTSFDWNWTNKKGSRANKQASRHIYRPPLVLLYFARLIHFLESLFTLDTSLTPFNIPLIKVMSGGVAPVIKVWVLSPQSCIFYLTVCTMDLFGQGDFGVWTWTRAWQFLFQIRNEDQIVLKKKGVQLKVLRAGDYLSYQNVFFDSIKIPSDLHLGFGSQCIQDYIIFLKRGNTILGSQINKIWRCFLI